MDDLFPPGLSESGSPPGGVLMEAGWLPPSAGRPKPAQVRRGMAVLSADGQPLGHVAAVVAPRGSGTPPAGALTHLLLARWGAELEYRLVPAAAIAAAGAGTVRLSTPAAALDAFARHTPPDFT